MDGESSAQQSDREVASPGLEAGFATERGRAGRPVRVDATLSPGELLSVPHRKRLAYAYIVNDAGGRELRIDYGRKEILFDEAHLFPFGEQLTREASFTGAQATAWGPGYAWDELRPLLETLIAEGIIERGDATFEPRGGGTVASRLPASVCPVPRYWSAADCESIMRELSGRAVEFGNLETVLPIYRVAHAALDGDDRQVGEANVNPWLLRLDRETEWRTCQYPGSRYRDEMPMNVTALKAMIKHWKPMMATLLEVRRAVAQRLAIAHAPWSIGELHVLSCAVLALPAYQLMRLGGTTPQHPVHPVLSSLFRITDGIRMTTSDMVTSVTRPRPPEAPLTGAELYARAEEDGLFISRTGVCAGPKHMIDDFLAIAVDGHPAEGVTGDEIPDEVRALLADLPAALDYAGYGMQIWALAFSIWLAMSQAHEALLAVLEAADDRSALRPRLRDDGQAIRWKEIANEHDRQVHLNLYVHTYDLAARCVRVAVGGTPFGAQIAAAPEAAPHHAAADRLRGLLVARLPAQLADWISALLIGYLREEQAVLAAIAPLVAAVNTLLGRPQPLRPLTVRDLHVHHYLRKLPWRFPYLLDSLDEALGIHIECTATTIDVQLSR